MKSSPLFIGNKKTKETHLPSCFCLRRMNKENRIEFRSLKQAMNQGYDTCGHCLESAKEKDPPQPVHDYSGQFCVLLEEREYCNYGSNNVVGQSPREELVFRVKLSAADTNVPVEDEKIKIVSFPDDFTEVAIGTVTTNAQGIAEIGYDPGDLEQGVTRFRAYFPESTDLGSAGSGNAIDLLIDFLPAIENVWVDPKAFKRSTTIHFDLLEDTPVNIAIYKGTNFSGPFSHRKTIRRFNDGVLHKGDDIQVEWDGTNERGKQVWRGRYVVRLETSKDFVYNDSAYKSKGKW